MICINERHYPMPEPPNKWTADPRIHWPDETECCDAPILLRAVVVVGGHRAVKVLAG